MRLSGFSIPQFWLQNKFFESQDLRIIFRLPSGLRKALKTSGWEYERILNGRCTDMESSLVCLIVDYGVEMTFDEDGIIQEC